MVSESGEGFEFNSREQTAQHGDVEGSNSSQPTADMMELVDMSDLGSDEIFVGVQVPLSVDLARVRAKPLSVLELQEFCSARENDHCALGM